VLRLEWGARHTDLSVSLPCGKRLTCAHVDRVVVVDATDAVHHPTTAGHQHKRRQAEGCQPVATLEREWGIRHWGNESPGRGGFWGDACWWPASVPGIAFRSVGNGLGREIVASL